MFKQGDRVKIRSGSQYHYQSDNTEGVIVSIDLNAYLKHYYTVRFDNNSTNEYRESDLELVQPIKTELIINLW